MARHTARIAAVATLTTALGGLVSLPAASAEAPPTGWVRVGHLSPDTPPVDVYLASLGGAEQQVIRKAAYGDLSPYSNLVPGQYTIAMRPAGAAPDSAAILSWTVQVDPGSAATVLAVGKRTELRSTVVADELTPPSEGKAKVRLIQGAPSEAKVEVTAVGGPTLARDVSYGTATGYAEVPEGRWSLDVKASGTSTSTVDAPAGSVQSLVVLDKPGGGLEVRPVADGSGMTVMPAGGVETGAGGTTLRPIGMAALGGVAVLFVGGAVLMVRRRATTSE